MKHGITSIIIAIIGIIFLCYFGYKVSENIIMTLNESVGYHNFDISSETIVSTPWYYNFTIIILVSLSILFGSLSIKEKNTYGYIGIFLSVVLIYLFYQGFFINLFLSDSALDINYTQ